MPTVSRKSERLVNLTIALLASKRYLTKSEIFRTVDGYEGAPEAMERMFERDKDDLRSLGITIELGSFDPLFEDEAGYRITPSSYRLDLGELDGADVAVLSLAAKAWTGAALERESTSALVKLSSMGLDSDAEALSLLAPRVSGTDKNFVAITEAIMRKSEIEFDYVSGDLSKKHRRVAPYSLRGEAGAWYLLALDLDKNLVRTFRLDRFVSDVAIARKSNSYVIPDELAVLSPEESTVDALLRVRKNRCSQLRSLGVVVDLGEDWDQIRIPILDLTSLLRIILWHRDDVVVMEPVDLRESVITTLKEMSALHG